MQCKWMHRRRRRDIYLLGQEPVKSWAGDASIVLVLVEEEALININTPRPQSMATCTSKSTILYHGGSVDD